MGLLLLVLASVSVLPLIGNDDEPVGGGVTKTGEKASQSSLVEIELGSDTVRVRGEAAEEPDSQSQPEGAPSKKVFRGNKSETEEAPAPGTATSRGRKTKKSSGKTADPGGPMSGGMMGPMGPAGMSGMVPGPMGRSSAGRGTNMGGMPSGTGTGPGNPFPALKLYAEGGHVILKQSEAGDTLWGYSEKLGKWTKLAIPKGKDLLTPVVGVTVGGFWDEAGGRLFAYSSSTGRWAELKSSGVPTTSSNKIMVQDQDRVFIFSDVNGRWSSNTDAADSQPVGNLPGFTTENDASSDIAPSNSFVDDAGRPIELGDFDSDGRL
ncbi:MAG TPA: hypothetical protein VGH74_09025, partial [Planctomycetaceae bacterium]